MSRNFAYKPVSERSFVACRIAKSTYAIPITRVREIILPLPLTGLPEAPNSVIGAVDHRGEVVPILDMTHVLLGEHSNEAKRKWVIVRSGDKTFGIVVRQVFEVFRAVDSEVRKAPDLGGVAGYTTREVVNFGGQMAFVLDIDAASSCCVIPAAPPELGAHL